MSNSFTKHCALLAFFFLSLQAHADRFDFGQISDELLHTYDQKKLKYDDVLGDAIFCEKLLKAPEFLKQMKSKNFDYDRYARPEYVKSAEAQIQLQKKTQISEKDQKQEEIILGRESPFNIKGFEKMFTEVLRQESAAGLKITAGTEHKWSKALKKSDRGHCTIPFMISKLLAALIVGQSAMHMATGTEQEYLKWILRQPTRSITPESAFRSSLRINKGNVYLALLTIENIYSAAWTVRGRESLPWILKVKTMVNANNQVTNDNFGPWYHFWGMVLYSYLRNPAWSLFVARAENASTLFIVKSNRKQKLHTNVAGAKVGARLAKTVRRESFKHARANPGALVFENYIQQNEDFRDRIKVKTTPQIALSLSRSMRRSQRSVSRNRSSYLTINTSMSLKNCQVDVIPNYGSELDARKIVNFKNVTFEPYKPLKFTLSRSRNTRGVRVFIFGCSNTKQQYIQELPVK